MRQMTCLVMGEEDAEERVLVVKDGVEDEEHERELTRSPDHL